MSGSLRPARHDLVVATQDLPIRHDPGIQPAIRWWDGAGHAHTALRPVVAERNGAWLGGSESTAGLELPRVEGVWPYPVPLDGPDVDDHHRHCAQTLAPLYHDCGEQPVFDQRWQDAYETVNLRFAASLARAAAPGGRVWVHDYHLQLVPGTLRRLRPDLRIGFFLHTPFPPVERFMRLPTRERVVHSLLGADVIGFQHARSAANFLDLVGHLSKLPTGADFIEVRGRRVRVVDFPSSVDIVAVQRLAVDPAVRARAAAIRAELRNPRTVLLSLGSFEQSDGVEPRLDAYAELLADAGLRADQVVLIHVATPGARELPHLSERRDQIDRRVAQINGLHALVGRPPVHYLHRDLDRAELVALYLAADVMLATPLHAGMALTAKEFVASRLDNTGSLVLSEFSGAVDDLPEAIAVNPYDVPGLKTAILAGVAQAGRENPAIRMMRERLRRHDATAWGQRFLSMLARAEPAGAASVGRTAA